MTTKHNLVDFQVFFTTLLSHLSEREQEVLKKRYQLTADVDSKNTLKKIGDSYGITRERVRQIEREAIDKLLKKSNESPYSEQRAQLSAALVHFVEQRGGAVTEELLVADHVLANHSFGQLHLNSFLFFLENLMGAVASNKESDDYNRFWILNSMKQSTLDEYIESVVDVIDTHGEVMAQDEMLRKIEKEVISSLETNHFSTLTEKHADVSTRDLAHALLGVTKKVEMNIMSDWGLTVWPTVKPKKLADKIRLVFSREQQPLHFREVAERINTANFDKKSICAATVHNELIANADYVLIGRGIYALKEWGYTPGTVTEIIVRILKSNEQPLSKEDIYQEVLKQRKVNSSTIYLSLINKDKFEKLPNGFFSLK